MHGAVRSPAKGIVAAGRARRQRRLPLLRNLLKIEEALITVARAKKQPYGDAHHFEVIGVKPRLVEVVQTMGVVLFEGGKNVGESAGLGVAHGGAGRDHSGGKAPVR